MFVQMMLKSMRAALPQDGELSTEQTKLYTSMYDQQIAQDMSGSLGIADMLVQQLSGNKTSIPDSVGTTPMALDGETIQSMPVRALEQVMRRAMPRIPQNGSPMPTSNGEFVTQLSGAARAVSQQSGIPHQLIVAQAALESGWGQREIPTTDGSRSFNLFGIKAGLCNDTATTEISTTEFENGVAHKVKAKFRVYGSYLEAISDYVQLLTNNPRYANVTSANTPEQAAHALQKAGYATDPNYASKLVQVIGQIKNAGEQVVKAYTTDLERLF